MPGISLRVAVFGDRGDALRLLLLAFDVGRFGETTRDSRDLTEDERLGLCCRFI